MPDSCVLPQYGQMSYGKRSRRPQAEQMNIFEGFPETVLKECRLENKCCGRCVYDALECSEIFSAASWGIYTSGEWHKSDSDHFVVCHSQLKSHKLAPGKRYKAIDGMRNRSDHILGISRRCTIPYTFSLSPTTSTDRPIKCCKHDNTKG